MTPDNQADDLTLENQYDRNIRSDSVLHPSDIEKELKDARTLIEALESEQVHLYRELELMQEQNHRYMKMLSNKDFVEGHSVLKDENYCLKSDDLEKQGKLDEGISRMSLHAKLNKLTKELEIARLVNCQYQEDQASQFSRQHQVDLVCEQAEMETARTILHLQEEVAALQLELHERLCCMTQENTCLRHTIAAKDEEIRALHLEWEKASLELTNFLVDGSRSLRDASGQIESIVCLFPQFNVEITENVERAAKACIEKEETIGLLQKSLEDAQKMVAEMEDKLSSLKGATIALNEFRHLDNEESTEDAIQLRMKLDKKINMVKLLEVKLKSKEDQIVETDKRAEAAFLVVKWLSDSNKVGLGYERNSDLAAQSLKEHRSLKFEKQFHVLQQIKDELAETNDRLHIIEDVINKKSLVHDFPTKDEDLIDVDGWTVDCSTSISDYSTESVASERSSERSSCSYFSKFCSKETEDVVDSKFQGGSAPKLDPENSDKVKKLLKRSVNGEAMTFDLRKELEMAFDAFSKLYFQLSVLLNENDAGAYPFMEGTYFFFCFPL